MLPEKSIKLAPSTNLRTGLAVKCLKKAWRSFTQRRHKAAVGQEGGLDPNLGGWSVGATTECSFSAGTSPVVCCSGTLRALTELTEYENDSSNHSP